MEQFSLLFGPKQNSFPKRIFKLTHSAHSAEKDPLNIKILKVRIKKIHLAQPTSQMKKNYV